MIIKKLSAVFFVYALSSFLVSGCAPVKFFSSKESAPDCVGAECGNPGGGGGGAGGGGAGGGETAIACGPKINDTQTQITYTTGMPKPKITANCNPSAVTYSWSVKKDGSDITINGLENDTSYPDFTAYGNGAYEISLTASANGYLNFQSPAPLTVVLNYGAGDLPDIACSPNINGSQSSIAWVSGNANPVFAANCNPTDVSYTWTVKNPSGATVAIPGLSGSGGTGDLTGLPPGKYEIFLNAAKDQYDPYLQTTPLIINIGTAGGGYRDVTFTKTVGADDNDVDILLVMDDSNSMSVDNQHISTRLQGFVTDLEASGINWQMCMTLTHAVDIGTKDTYFWGGSIFWKGLTTGNKMVLKKGQANVYSIIVNTIKAFPESVLFDEERAIKAAYHHAYNGDPSAADASGCYRKKAGLAVIILSDEDEFSVGGDCTQAVYTGECKPLEMEDIPANYVKQVQNIFGADKRLVVNSIIVRPGDLACKKQQDASGPTSHYGYKYKELSELTSGGVTSICEKDYSTNLKYFKDRIVSSLASVPLECDPIGAEVNVKVTPEVSQMTTRIENQALIFTPKIPAGREIQIKYKCPK